MSKKKKNKKNKSQKDNLLKKIDELENLEKNDLANNNKTEEITVDNSNEKSDANSNDSNKNASLKDNNSTKNEEKEVQNNTDESHNFDKNKLTSKPSESEEHVSKEEKAIVKVEKLEPPTLLEKEAQRKKKNLSLLILIIVLIVIVLIFSVIFAFINVTKSVVINGVSIKNIDVSNLTLSETKSKIEEAFNIELNCPINLKSKDYETTLNSSQIEFTYDIAKAAEEAYSVGRSGNIFQNNYAILSSTIFGENIEPSYSYNDESLDYIVDDIESKMPGLVTEASFYREGNELIIIPGTDGIKVNKEELKNNIIKTILSADAYDLLQNNKKLEIEIPIESAKAGDINIDKIHSEIYTEPKDAYFETDPFKIYTEVEGVDFAISINEAKNMIKNNQDEYRIPLTITPAQKSIKDIGLEAFPYVISEFTTKYDASNKNRSQNLAIAAGKIDGTVLMPGEEFSFNQVVGKRTIQEGYKDAKIYQDGQVVDGLAGGICQISSTLYNAVVKANLEVTERRNHSFTTSYIRAGQDATVVYGVIDFKFKNTRTYPIKISASVNSGIAGFKINGIKEEVEYDISLSPVTTGTIPYSTQVIPDPSLAPGQQVVVQGGGNGLKVTTYKDTKLDGKLVSREVMSTDTYRPMNAIIRVGP